MSLINKLAKFNRLPINFAKALSTIVDPPEEYLTNEGQHQHRQEPLEQKRARLLYQSRKRGILENDLILSTFAAKYLDRMNEQQMDYYDQFLNIPSNDWEIYYWLTEKKPLPKEFDNEVTQLLIQHVRNQNREKRYRMPDL